MQNKKNKLIYFIILFAFLFLLFILVNNISSLKEFLNEYKIIFFRILNGLYVTLYVSIISYLLSIFLGLILALLRMSRFYLLNKLIMIYVEFIRSIPILVVLFYITYTGTSFLVKVSNFFLSPLILLNIIDALSVRDISFSFRAISALVFCYSVFISENFRAGIESVDKGQMEACKALGLSWWQAMTKVILPQAFKNISPTLINELVAVIKDSSLVSVLGVKDITFLGKTYASSTFKFFETYNVVALTYIIIIFSLSFFAKKLEKKLK